MKAQNHKSVVSGYLFFSISLFCSILTAVICVWFFTITSRSEVTHIEKRSIEYDKSFERQIMLTEKIDSLYSNLTMLNSGLKINELVLQNRISDQKMNLITIINNIDEGDVLLYKKMSDKINDILGVKDSIRVMRIEAEQIKSDLQRCIQDNRAATRKVMFNNQR